jgi:hypothetical protein
MLGIKMCNDNLKTRKLVSDALITLVQKLQIMSVIV